MRPHPFLLAWFIAGLLLLWHEAGFVAVGFLLLGVFIGRLWRTGQWS